jgi:hypothetical protein
MKGKVNCSGCGHSWNKSDSSKKDMYICHKCGKDNIMKDGGWLNKYEDGGSVQENYNDSSVSFSEDFVGLGYDTKGRNYSPAWGGQFQDGGKLSPVPLSQQLTSLIPKDDVDPTVPFTTTKDPAKFYKSWIQTPEYEKRQLLTGYLQSSKNKYETDPIASEVRNIRIGSLENIAPITYSDRQPSEARPGYYGSPSYVNINSSDYTGTSRESIIAHELGHIAGATDRSGGMSSLEKDIFRNSMLPMKKPVISGVQDSEERNASIRNLEDFMHLQKPYEAKADLDALRFMMYDKGVYDITKGKKFTETDFEKAKENLGKDRVFKRLTDRVGKKNFINLMNTIASADEEIVPIAMNGASMPGSVGFTYARTGDIPSNGKYAKKTMASAQNGAWLDDIKQVSPGSKDYRDAYEQRRLGYYNPETNTFNIAQDMDTFTVSAPRMTLEERYAEMNPGKVSPTRPIETLNLPSTDLRRRDVMSPNMRGLAAGRTGETGRSYAEFHGDVMSAMTPIPGIQQMGRIPNIKQGLEKGLQQTGKYLTEETALRNAYKLNPYAFKPNPEAYYRQVGKDAIDDALSSKLIREKGEIVSQENYDKFLDQLQDIAGTKEYLNYEDKYRAMSNNSHGPMPYFQKGELFYGDKPTLSIREKGIPLKERKVVNLDHLIESNYGPENFQSSYGYKMRLGNPEEVGSVGILKPDPTLRDLENFNLYKKNWLKGYKEIPKKQNGGEMRFYQNGLDWKPKSMQDGGVQKTSEEIEKEKIKKARETAFKTIQPSSYDDLKNMGRWMFDVQRKTYDDPRSEEFWRHYLQQPGELQYLKPSQYKPTISTNKNVNYYSVDDELEKAIFDSYKDKLELKEIKQAGESDISKKYNKDTLQNFIVSNPGLGDRNPSGSIARALGNFTVSKGKDDKGEYISYYDTYDFPICIQNKVKGEPYEIYGRVYYPNQKNGGITKDNQGYWNPDNWGNPVEINSNNITMEGVYEPLLGISDTGDTKLMKPGKNYKFKGKKVREYPIAKLGINDLDAQPMKKLNQLINFTNNPDKTNWLEKYN